MNSRKLLLDRLLLSLALILEWHCAALTWHWTLDFLFCINQCLNSWRPSKFQSCANKITISITLFVRNALVAPVICDENQFRAAWYMEIMAYVYVREKLWRYELSDRGNMQDKYADCGLVVGGDMRDGHKRPGHTRGDAGVIMMSRMITRLFRESQPVVIKWSTNSTWGATNCDQQENKWTKFDLWSLQDKCLLLKYFAVKGNKSGHITYFGSNI